MIKFNIFTNKKAPGSLFKENHHKIFKTATKQKIFAYQQRIKSINYAVVIIKSNIVYVCLKLSEFFINLFQAYIATANQMIFYLNYTKHFLITFDAQMTNLYLIFLVLLDVFYADDKNTLQFSELCFQVI